MPPHARSARALLVAACLAAPASASAAQGEVSLVSPDGAIALSGSLVGFDGAYYRLDTIYGLLTIAAADVACEGPGCPAAAGLVPEVALAGSPTVGAGLIPALIADLAVQEGLVLQPPGASPETAVLADPAGGRPAMRFALSLSSSDAGLIALLSGQADAALSLNQLSDPEVTARVLALDAFVPLVAPGNPLAQITLPELAAVLAGEIVSWADLGGPDRPIAVHARAGSSGVQQALETLVLAPLGLPLAEGAHRHASAEALAAAVAADPAALGVGLWSQPAAARRLALADACGTVLALEAETIRAGDNPLALPFLLHAPAGRLPEPLRRLLAHAATDAGQAAIRRTGLVDQHPAPMPAAAGPLPPALQGATRLSTTVRFAAGTAEPDIAGKGAIAQLARALEAGSLEAGGLEAESLAGRTLVFAGFTDVSGPADTNLRLSQERAQAVLEAVRAAAGRLQPGRVRLVAEGFGATRPIACDASLWGRALNRRVEVWLR